MTIDKAQLKALAEAAAPGPWSVCGSDLYWHEDGYTKHLMETVEGSDICHDAQHPANLVFIAAASPARILAMLAEIDRLTQFVVRRREEVDQFDKALIEVGNQRDKLRAELDQMRDSRDQIATNYNTVSFTAEKRMEELETLRAELAGLRTGYDAQNQVIAELRSDAARYEWAISRIERVEILSSVVICHDGNTEKINERIDAYMEVGNGGQ